MTDCKRLEKCLFFNNKLDNMPKLAERYKNKFCKGDCKNCARYIVAEATGSCPNDLFPNQIERVEKIINK